MISYLNGIKIEINKKSHLSLEYLCDIEDKLNEKIREYNTKSLSKRKNSSPPVLKNQNIKYNDNVIMKDPILQNLVFKEKKDNSVKKNKQPIKGIVNTKNDNDKIESIIHKLEFNIKNYPFYPSIQTVKDLISKNKEIQFDESRYDDYCKKLSKELEEYEVFFSFTFLIEFYC